MTTLSQIRRLALIAAIGCLMLVGSAVPAGARPIDDPSLPNAPAASSTVRPATGASTGSPAKGSDWTLPIVLAGGVLLIVVVGSAGYARRNRMSHRAIA